MAELRVIAATRDGHRLTPCRVLPEKRKKSITTCSRSKAFSM
jgi:hypothetical protein